MIRPSWGLSIVDLDIIKRESNDEWETKTQRFRVQLAFGFLLLRVNKNY